MEPPTSQPHAGNPALAFRACFDECYGPVRAYVRRRCSNPGTVDDVVADVFLIAWRRWDELATVDPKLPWLYRVAQNTLRNATRSNTRHLRLVSKMESQPETPPSLATGDPATGTDNPVLDALNTLSDSDQELLRLIAWEGLTHAEAATVLDATTEAISSRVRRARDRLAAALDNQTNQSLNLAT